MTLSQIGYRTCNSLTMLLLHTWILIIMSVIIVNTDLMIENDKLTRNSHICPDFDRGNIDSVVDGIEDLRINSLFQAPIYYPEEAKTLNQ